MDTDLQNFAKDTQDFISSHPVSVWHNKGATTLSNTLINMGTIAGF